MQTVYKRKEWPVFSRATENGAFRNRNTGAVAVFPPFLVGGKKIRVIGFVIIGANFIVLISRRERRLGKKNITKAKYLGVKLLICLVCETKTRKGGLLHV